MPARGRAAAHVGHALGHALGGAAAWLAGGRLPHGLHATFFLPFTGADMRRA